MLVLLPPSESKRPGGAGDPWRADALRLRELDPLRESAIDALVALSADPDEAARVLKLGARQRDDIARNAELRSSPTMPAVDRYTGVLFDALGADRLDAEARGWLGANVLIHSALFGPVGALDPIPYSRFSAGSRLPALAPLNRFWGAPVTRAIAALDAPFVLDLRSEAYVRLGPVPSSVASAYVRVVSRASDGVVRALNHFNKHAKGDLVRRLALDRPIIRSRADLLAWGAGAGIEWIDRAADPASGGGSAHEIELVATA